MRNSIRRLEKRSAIARSFKTYEDREIKIFRKRDHRNDIFLLYGLSGNLFASRIILLYNFPKRYEFFDKNG